MEHKNKDPGADVLGLGLTAGKRCELCVSVSLSVKWGG